MRKPSFGWFCVFVLIITTPLRAQSQISVATAPVPISPDSVRLTQPIYSPDSKWIAAAGDGYRGIVLLDSAGVFIRCLTRSEGAGFRFQWCQDSQRLVCRISQTENKRRQSAIALFSLQSDSLTLLTGWERDLTLPNWYGRDKIYFLNQGELQVLDCKSKPDDEGENWLRYHVPQSSQKSCLVVYSVDDRLVLQDGAGQCPTIFVYPDHHLLQPVLSPDGNWVAFEVAGVGLQVAHRYGKPIFKLGDFHDPCWNPSGDWLVCAATRDDGLRVVSAELYVITRDGKQSIQLTATDAIQESLPCWSPDGKTIVCSDNRSGRIFRLTVQLAQSAK